MDKGEVAAWLAVLVAIGAAWIATHNANSAKTQAGAALTQAKEAKKTAAAAQEQVEIMRQTLTAENADRHERSGPTFSVVEGKRTKWTRVITVTMLSGPAEVLVSPSWTGDSSVPGSGRDVEDGIQAAEYEPQRMLTNRSFDIPVTESKVTNPIEFDVFLHCTDASDPSRMWRRTYSVTLKPSPGGGRVVVC